MTSKHNSPQSRFVILIPHRDTIGPFDEYRAKLFAKGFAGAYSFPLAAPLAEVSRPFCREELKELGRSIRKLTGKNGGWISCSGNTLVSHPKENLTGFRFLGPELGLQLDKSTFPQTAGDKILHLICPAVICGAICAVDSGSNGLSEEAKPISFRAAALANLAIRRLGEGDPSFSFKWRIGEPVWLPAYKKPR